MKKAWKKSIEKAKIIWKLIKEVKNKNKTIKQILPNAFKENDIGIGVIVHKEIAERFNKYFLNIGPRLAEQIPENIMNFASYLGNSNVDSIVLDPVTEREIEIELKPLKIDKSYGYDEMSLRVVNMYIKWYSLCHHVKKSLRNLKDS